MRLKSTITHKTSTIRSGTNTTNKTLLDPTETPIITKKQKYCIVHFDVGWYPPFILEIRASIWYGCDVLISVASLGSQYMALP
jgi:hypothetical protein